MRKITPITRKVNVLIIVSLVIGTGAVIGFLAYRSSQALEENTLAD